MTDSTITTVEARHPSRRRSLSILWPETMKAQGRLQQGLVIGLLSVGALAMLAPFVWMVTTSFSRDANISMPATPTFIPQHPSWHNFQIVLDNIPIARYYANSVIVSVLSTVGYLFFSSLTGYAFAKGSFRGKTFFFIAFLATLLVPFETRMIPLYLMMQRFHLDNSLTALVLPFVVGGFGTFLMRQAMSGIPDELIQAARVDGAGESGSSSRSCCRCANPHLPY